MFRGPFDTSAVEWSAMGAIFAASVLASLVATPIIRAIARKIGMLAKPNPLVKSHTSATAYLGGVAVYLSFALTVCTFAGSLRNLLFVGLIGLMVVLGALDDRKPFTPRGKLFGQFVISVIALGMLRRPEWPLVVYPAILLWLLLCSNALNLVDVMDGLATGLAACALGGLSVVAFLSGSIEMACVCTALTGSILGFLPFNWNRASIFLGDAGSLGLGFAVGLAPLLETTAVLSWHWWVFSFTVVAIPLFEVAFLFVLRTRARKPFWRGSRDHFALRLHHAGWPIPRIVLLSCAVASTLIAAAVFCHRINGAWLMAIPAFAALVFGVAGVILAKIRI